MKKIVSVSLLLVMMLSLCACGESKYASPAYAPADMYNEPTFYAGDFDEAPVESMMESTALFSANGSAPAPAPRKAAGETSSEDSDSGSETIRPEKIIYSASATVEATDFDSAILRLQEMIDSCGGFIESSSMSDNSYYRKARGYSGTRSASFTVRVPGTVFHDIIGGLSTLGNVPYSHCYSQNVTSQYYDIQAHLEAYKAQEQRLLELMEIAETIDDIIAVEERLTEVRYSIDSMQSSLINYDRKVSFSTIELSIEEVAEYTPTPTVSLSFGEKLVRAAKDGLEQAGEFLEDLALWLAESLPTLVILAVLVFLALIPGKKAFRAMKSRIKAKKEAKAAGKASKSADNK